MDHQGDHRFGRGPKELCGAVDLVNRFKLLPHHELFCKKSLPLSISETQYLHNVVGDTEIRKGEGMELEQLFCNTTYLRERKAHLNPFDFTVLMDAFRMRETTPTDLPSAEKGIPTTVGKSKTDLNNMEMKHKRHKDKDHKKHKHHDKDRTNEKGIKRSDGKDRTTKKDKTRSGIELFPGNLKKQRVLKRRHDGL